MRYLIQPVTAQLGGGGNTFAPLAKMTRQHKESFLVTSAGQAGGAYVQLSIQ